MNVTVPKEEALISVNLEKDITTIEWWGGDTSRNIPVPLRKTLASVS
jgi:hypothetical protein